MYQLTTHLTNFPATRHTLSSITIIPELHTYYISIIVYIADKTLYNVYLAPLIRTPISFSLSINIYLRIFHPLRIPSVIHRADPNLYISLYPTYPIPHSHSISRSSFYLSLASSLICI